jgi:alkanesulfonate monooxygenase SsuD/methylene tetrahydromethanopterin reductase-like flavin-dependent oxidoreductase (luciferase family)
MPSGLPTGAEPITTATNDRGRFPGIKTIKIGQFCDVALNASDVAADRLHGRVELFLPPARDENVGTLSYEELCGRQHYPGCATGNDCYFSLQLLMARALGAKHAISSTTNHAKAEQAKALGFKEVIDTSLEKLGDGVRRVTDGYGADIVIDGIGGEVLSEALKALALGGSLTTLGYSASRKTTIDVTDLIVPQASIRSLNGDGRLDCMKKIGFLSFGHWTPSPQSRTQSAADALLQSIDLAVEAERLGMDGAFFRVHHFAQQLASPFPLLAAVGAKTRRIEIGTAVIDMRYENPHYMAEDAGAADLIAGDRLQLGISRGSPEQVIDGWRYFGYRLAEGVNDADLGRRHAEEFFELLRGKGFARPNPRPMFPNPPGLLRLEPYSEGLRDWVWWGSASNATAVWAAKLGMNMQTSTLKFDETGEPLHIQQAAQIRAFRAAWKEAGHTRTPRVSVSRSIFALLDDRDRAYFGRGSKEEDQIGFLDENTRAIFGRSYAAEPDVLIEQLKKDEAIAEADTLLLAIPNQLGVAYNAHVLDAILITVAPAVGWR